MKRGESLLSEDSCELEAIGKPEASRDDVGGSDGAFAEEDCLHDDASEQRHLRVKATSDRE